MIKRLVKMEFDSEQIEEFIMFVTPLKAKIKAVQGCLHLEFWRGIDSPTTIFTYSMWDSDYDLEQYRQSELFKETWAVTKQYFSDKPYAISVQEIL